MNVDSYPSSYSSRISTSYYESSQATRRVNSESFYSEALRDLAQCLYAWSEGSLFSVFQQLEDEIGANSHLRVELPRFTQEVRGLEKQVAGKVMAMPITLEAEPQAEKYGGNSKDERHKSFLDLCALLLRDASKEQDDENATFTGTF